MHQVTASVIKLLAANVSLARVKHNWKHDSLPTLANAFRSPIDKMRVNTSDIAAQQIYHWLLIIIENKIQFSFSFPL